MGERKKGREGRRKEGGGEAASVYLRALALFLISFYINLKLTFSSPFTASMHHTFSTPQKQRGRNGTGAGGGRFGEGKPLDTSTQTVFICGKRSRVAQAGTELNT